MHHVIHSIGEHRVIFFAGPEGPDLSESGAKVQAGEKQEIDTEQIAKDRGEKLAKVQSAETLDRAQDEIQQKDLSQQIEAWPAQEVLDAISRVEKMYRDFAIRWSRSDDHIDMTTADPAMEPIKKAWNDTRPGPKRTAIESALNTALARATADTPNVQFHAAGYGGSLDIAGSRRGNPERSATKRTNDRQSRTPTMPPALQQLMSYFRQLFGRASMDRVGTPAINRFNRESTLAIASVTPGTQWNAPDNNGQPQPNSLVPGTYNLDINFKTPLPMEQSERYLDTVMRAADGKYGANGNNLGLRIQSLTTGQITKALDAARRWEQAHTAGDRATDELRGVPLQDRNAVLTSYRALQTDVQRTYFRSMMGRASLDVQAPLARVLASLTPHMTQDLAAGGPLHEPDISSFQLQVRGMPRAERDALFHNLPIGDVAVRLYFPTEAVRRGPHLAMLSIS